MLVDVRITTFSWHQHQQLVPFLTSYILVLGGVWGTRSEQGTALLSTACVAGLIPSHAKATQHKPICFCICTAGFASPLRRVTCI
jgi:hypothetical protein